MKFPIIYYFKYKLFFTTPQSLPTANPAPLTRGAKRWNPKLRYFTSFSKSICYSTINPISFLFIAKAFLNPRYNRGFSFNNKKPDSTNRTVRPCFILFYRHSCRTDNCTFFSNNLFFNYYI